MLIGIDLGTTNSLAAAYIDGEVKIIPNRLGKELTPSVVAVDDEGTVLVGETAKEYGILHPVNAAKVFKRSMGTDKEYELGSKKMRAEELSSLVLRSLKEDAESYLGCEVNDAGRAEAERENVKALQEYGAKKEEVSALEAEYAEADKLVQENATSFFVLQYAKRREEIQERLDAENAALDELAIAYDDSEKVLEGYYSDIATYEKAQALLLEGKTTEAVNTIERKNEAFRTAVQVVGESAEEQKRILEQQVVDTELIAQSLERRWKAGVEGVTEDLVNIAKETARKAKTEFEKVGGDSVEGLKTGVDSKKDSLISKYAKMASDALARVKSIFRQASPSKAFRDVSINNVLGLEVGVEKEKPAFLKTMDSLANDALKTFDEGVGKVNLSASMGFDSMDGASTNLIKYGGTTINVYASEGMDEMSLANKVQSVIDNNINRRLEVWA